MSISGYVYFLQESVDLKCELLNANLKFEFEICLIT